MEVLTDTKKTQNSAIHDCWTHKDWYKFIVEQVHALGLKQKKNPNRINYDAIVSELMESHSDMSPSMKKDVRNYTLNEDTRSAGRIMRRVLAVIIIGSIITWGLVYLNQQRWEKEYLGGFIAGAALLIAIIIIVMLTEHRLVYKRIRHAIIRYCGSNQEGSAEEQKMLSKHRYAGAFLIHYYGFIALSDYHLCKQNRQKGKRIKLII